MRAAKQFLMLIFIGSMFTIIAGALFNGWFGDLPAYLGFGDMAPMPPMVKAASGVIVPASFHFDFYKDRKVATAEVQQSPIFSPTQTDGYVVLNTA